MSRAVFHSVCSLAAVYLASAAQLTALPDGHFLDNKRSTAQIPNQIVMTGKEETLDEIQPKMRKNVKKTLELNPGMTVRYLSDRQCRMYVRQHCDDEIADAYLQEPAGHFRGDICRAAVLFQEGGFYTDLDLQPRVPFQSLIDESTQFMSVVTSDDNILNALMATVPGSPVMKETLEQIKKWYKTKDHQQSEGTWMGTATLKAALDEKIKANCPETNFGALMEKRELQWQCGPDAYRFYREMKLDCPVNVNSKLPMLIRKLGGVPTPDCPRERMASRFDGLKYGIYTPGDKKLVAWSRAVSCDTWWCGGR